MGDQRFTNKLSLDLRNGVTDELSNDVYLSFGEVRTLLRQPTLGTTHNYFRHLRLR